MACDIILSMRFFCKIFAFAFLSASVFAVSPKVSFDEADFDFAEDFGGFVGAKTDEKTNEIDVPLSSTRGAIVPKENIFGDVISKNTLLFRSVLGKSQKNAYDEIFSAVLQWDGNLDLSKSAKIKKGELKNVILAVLNDNPELFWWTGDCVFYSNSDETVTRIEFSYLFPKEDSQKVYDEFWEMSAPIVFYASLLEDKMERVKYVHDYICLSVNYDLESFRSGNYGGTLQSAYSAIVKYKTVCAGYARAFQYYMQQLEIPCAVIESESHAWNLLILQNQCYQMDVTWDDNKIYPQYFNLNHDEMKEIAEHTPDNFSQKVIFKNQNSKKDFEYERYFGDIAQGGPYTYAELEKFETDVENPSDATVFTKEPTRIQFAKNKNDVQKMIFDAAKNSSAKKITIQFVAKNKAVANEIDRFLQNKSDVLGELKNAGREQNFSWGWKKSSGNRNISYKIILEEKS